MAYWQIYLPEGFKCPVPRFIVDQNRVEWWNVSLLSKVCSSVKEWAPLNPWNNMIYRTNLTNKKNVSGRQNCCVLAMIDGNVYGIATIVVFTGVDEMTGRRNSQSIKTSSCRFRHSVSLFYNFIYFKLVFAENESSSEIF